MNNLSTKDKMAGPETVLTKRFHCVSVSKVALWVLGKFFEGVLSALCLLVGK